MLIENKIEFESSVTYGPALKRIKVLHFSACPDGGIKRHILDVVENLPQDEFESQGAFIDPARCAVLGHDPEQTYYAHFTRMGMRCFLLDFPRHLSPAKDFKTLLELLRILRREQPDILHCHSSKAGIVGRIAGVLHPRCKVIYSPHCLYFLWQTGLRRAVYRWIERLFSPVGTIVAVSASEEAEIRRHIGVKPVRIHNGIGVGELAEVVPQRAAVLAELGIPKDAFVVLSITRLERVKDVPTLLRGFARLQADGRTPPHLVIAGDGILKPQIEQLIGELGIADRVHLLGWRSDVLRLLSACDCAVLTSISEGLPYALLEAAAMGKPIVASRVRGSMDVILDGRTGYLIDCGDADSLADRLHTLLTNPGLRKEFSARGKQFIKQFFSLDRMCRQYARLYRSYGQ